MGPKLFGAGGVNPLSRLSDLAKLILGSSNAAEIRNAIEAQQAGDYATNADLAEAVNPSSVSENLPMRVQQLARIDDAYFSGAVEGYMSDYQLSMLTGIQNDPLLDLVTVYYDEDGDGIEEPHTFYDYVLDDNGDLIYKPQIVLVPMAQEIAYSMMYGMENFLSTWNIARSVERLTFINEGGLLKAAGSSNSLAIPWKNEMSPSEAESGFYGWNFALADPTWFYAGFVRNNLELQVQVTTYNGNAEKDFILVECQGLNGSGAWTSTATNLKGAARVAGGIATFSVLIPSFPNGLRFRVLLMSDGPNAINLDGARLTFIKRG